MCFTYPEHAMAETMAPRAASLYNTPFAVFNSRGHDGRTISCTCPINSLECRPEEILVIYEPIG